jgi:hypothetical protein
MNFSLTNEKYQYKWIHPEELVEKYLDDNCEYWDYGTEPITNNKDIIDTHKTGHGSDVDIFLTPSGSAQMERKENRKGEIVMMSPDEYYSECANYAWCNSRNTPDSLKRSRRADAETIEKLKNVLTKFKRKFPIPYIDYASPGQEGLHRMMAIGDLYGWDFKVPVLTIKVADEQEERNRELRKRQWEIKMCIDDACTRAFSYTYRNIEEFMDQLQWELDRKFEYSDYLSPPIDFNFIVDGDILRITVEGVTVEYYKDVINIKEKDAISDEDIDIDWDDLEDIDTLLSK